MDFLYTARIPTEVYNIIQEKATAEGMPFNYAAGILFQTIIAGGQNKRRIYNANYYKRQKRGQKLTPMKYKYKSAKFKLFYEDFIYLLNYTNDEMDMLTSQAIKEIIEIWLQNENWKTEVLGDYGRE